jgi:hypothetical protein
MFFFSGLLSIGSLYAAEKINQSNLDGLMPFCVVDAVFNPSLEIENVFRTLP